MKNSKIESSNIEHKAALWGKVKFKPKKQDKEPQFNVVARDARFVAPTPWAKYRKDWYQTQQQAEKDACNPRMDSDEAKKCLRQREINYRRIRMQEKQNEPVEWESFENEEEETMDNAKYFKKNKSQKQPESKRPLIEEELLEDFDGRKLSYYQKDRMRRILTKGACLRGSVDLKKVIKNIKTQQKRKEEKQRKYKNSHTQNFDDSTRQN